MKKFCRTPGRAITRAEAFRRFGINNWPDSIGFTIGGYGCSPEYYFRFLD